MEQDDVVGNGHGDDEHGKSQIQELWSNLLKNCDDQNNLRLLCNMKSSKDTPHLISSSPIVALSRGTPAIESFNSALRTCLGSKHSLNRERLYGTADA